MQNDPILNENLSKMVENSTKQSGSFGNYIIMAGILLLCIVLFFLDFPFWAILIFGIGMNSILLLLHLIRKIQIELHAMEETMEQDLNY